MRVELTGLKMRKLILTTGALMTIIVINGRFHPEIRPNTSPNRATLSQLRPSPLQTLPMAFEPVSTIGGQDGEFSARGNGYRILIQPNGAILDRLNDRVSGSQPFKMRFLATNNSRRLSGVDTLPGTVNYFVGTDQRKWKTGIRTYSKVKCQNLYPRTDVLYYGTNRDLEYDFVLHPGADPSDIKIAVSGLGRSGSAELNAQGDLELRSTAGVYKFHAPVAYQVQRD